MPKSKLDQMIQNIERERAECLTAVEDSCARVRKLIRDKRELADFDLHARAVTAGFRVAFDGLIALAPIADKYGGLRCLD